MCEEMKLKIRLEYKGKWYYVTGVDIDKKGELYFGSHYLHDGEEHGVIDTDHIGDVRLVCIAEKMEGETLL